MRRYRVAVPMKPLSESKSRLASQVSPSGRALLSASMLANVLRAARAVPGISEVIVVGGDETVAAITDACGGQWRPDRTSGLNEALSAVFGEQPGGIAATVFLPGDLPLLAPADIDALLRASKEGSKVVLAPDGQEMGTNAIAVPAALGFTPMLGESSFERHLAQAEARGLAVAVCRRPGLTFDLDTVDDLRRLLDRRPRLWVEVVEAVSALGLLPIPSIATADL